MATVAVVEPELVVEPKTLLRSSKRIKLNINQLFVKLF